MDKKAPVIVVTGAAGGLGRILTGMLRARGCNVACVDRDARTLEAVIKETGGPGEAIAFIAEASSAADTKNVIDGTVKKWGHIDGLFLGAAINGDPGQLHTISEEMFEKVVGTNLKSVWLAVKYAVPAMIESGGGAIVTVGSVAATRGAPTLGVYAASKHGVLGLTRTLALEYAKQNIRANILCPGSMDTAMIQPMLLLRGGGDAEKGLAATVAGIPNGRLAKPQELASVGLWLLLDAPSHLNGQEITVDGGRTAA